MAEVAEIFFDTTIEEEEGGAETLDYEDDDDEEDDDSAFWSSVLDHPHPHHIVVDDFKEEEDDDGDFPFRHHSLEDYEVDALSSAFSHDFTVSNPPFGSGISLEDDSESSCVEEGAAYGINLDDRRFQQRPVDGGGGMDADSDILDLMGLGGESDYLDVGLGDGLGLGYGLGAEEQNFDDNVDCGVFGEDHVDVQDRSVDGLFFSCGSDRSATRYDRDEAMSRIVGYESGSESLDELATLGGEVLSRTGGYESELEFEDEQATVLGDTIDGVQASDWGGVDLGHTYTVQPHPARDVRRERNSEFEWEEVDGSVEEREVLQASPPSHDWLAREVADIESEDQEELGDVGWDLFLLLNNINDEQEGDPYGEDEHGALVHPSEYEDLFGQLANQESIINGSPPAAKCVVEKLPSIIVTEDDPTVRDIACAVCKDEIPLGMTVKQLPCKHLYHEDCIVPWLETRNTCPICRYELPTDDPDYERWRARANRVTDRFEE